MLTPTTVRLSQLDRQNIRRIMAHIRDLNRQAGIRKPVTQQDAIQWALHHVVLGFAEHSRKMGGKRD